MVLPLSSVLLSVQGSSCKHHTSPPPTVLSILLIHLNRSPSTRATTVAPFDMVRTRLMNQPPDAKIYKGFVDCVVKLVAAGGPGALYSGFIPIWARFAPTTCLQLVIFEQVKPIFGVEGSGE